MSESSYHSVRGLERGLAVLRAVNALGHATSVEVASHTGLPRPTVHRLLETLRTEGFLRRSGLRDPYRLTLKVKSLSGGYKDEDWITEIADVVLAELFDEVVWPTDIATFENEGMVIRSTTHTRSPLSIERSWVGRQLPMLSTAVGWTYLAFTPAKERHAILERIGAMAGPDQDKVRDPEAVRKTLATTRRRGYGTRQREFMPKTSSIAVPIMNGTHVLGCINIIWIDSAMTFDVATRRYLPLLRQAATRIEVAYAERVAV
ncbi:IclR family transcriptional regulator domain-containing protein [Ottowia thiooxydans]|uniref:IclR family mhp operon transcriptional activator n=1 Tax=Ottowia thiooxydans TaxID=219182 RepID=A0ABV2QF03_9BURK